MDSFHNWIAKISHPFQSLYRHLLYRESIPIASSSICEYLCRQWGKPEKSQPFTDEEKRLISWIRQQTKHHNRNNVTRTQAYLSFFTRFPEIHWALVAHLVSRNGGWNMTDLKGGLIPSIIGHEQIQPLFLFLERANALIFHDAYPQLLLYEASRQHNKALFHLLPAFSVSSFMRPFWEYFYQTKDSPLLTVALIINEQQYIQQRVVDHPFYQRHVLDSFPFLIQQWLGLNDLLIPYVHNERIHLAGITARDFADVYHRIQIGKALYGMLFYRKRILRGVGRFVSQTKHTGSRADFWPHIFSAINHTKAAHIYSPHLQKAWADVTHRFSDRRDWFHNLAILQEIKQIPFVKAPEITSHYKQNLKKLLAAAKLTN
ncbi:DUF2515 family protein [Anoxybacillus rupiensis]|uniref:DUF2515 family protein n=1 Tax=Anoxybacteroides rupiense TaxID=311460 RepID=A0ABD5IUF4_9BACL|nr:DUF2515 family protein [Anoxybacillus rupiensis]